MRARWFPYLWCAVSALNVALASYVAIITLLASCVVVHVHEAPLAPAVTRAVGSAAPSVVECSGVYWLDGHTDCTPVPTMPVPTTPVVTTPNHDPCASLTTATGSTEWCKRCPASCAVTTAPFGGEDNMLWPPSEGSAR